MTTNCNVRFLDNNKLSFGYTVTNEDGSFPLTNALSDIRSKLFKTTTTTTRIVIDLGFPDQIRAVSLFAPLGESLGITREATVKFQADNVLDWTAPEVDVTIPVTSDDRLVYFTDVYYRYVSLLIEDPTNPSGIINFADIFIGDYTTTTLRNVERGFGWTSIDPTTVQKSLNGTPYFDIQTQYDTLGLAYAYVTAEDRKTLENLYQRSGRYTWMPISIDPEEKIGSDDKNILTKLARFEGDFSRAHQVFEYYNIAIALEEVI